MEHLTRDLLEQLLSEDQLGHTICDGPEAQSIEFNRVIYTSDETKGFIRAKMSHAFPVVTVYGQGIHPNVVSKSWKSLMYQSVNLEHMVVAYDEANSQD